MDEVADAEADLEKEEAMSQVEAEQLVQQLQGRMGQAPANVFSFAQDLMSSPLTTKAGFLTEEELGTGSINMRACLEIADFADAINPEGGKETWQSLIRDRMLARAEILVATSLSKQAKLLDIVQTRKSFAKHVGVKPPKKSWFGKKPVNEFGEELI